MCKGKDTATLELMTYSPASPRNFFDPFWPLIGRSKGPGVDGATTWRHSHLHGVILKLWEGNTGLIRNALVSEVEFLNSPPLVGKRVANEAEGQGRPAELLGDLDALLSRGAV